VTAPGSGAGIPDLRDKYRLCRQWMIHSGGGSHPPGWQTFIFPSGATLAWHPMARVKVFPAGRGGLVGIGLLVNPLEAELGLYDARNLEHDHLARVLLHIGGTYVVLRYTEDDVFAYTDPAGMMGVYYSSEVAASTPALLPGLRRDDAIDREFPFQGVDNWYTGSLTPFVGVRCLLANHVLRISDKSSRRFWPEEGGFGSRPKEEALADCGRLLRGMLLGVAKLGRPLVSLTGGRDSRVNLAASRDMASTAEYFTIRSPNVKPCDLEIPSRLAGTFGLNHVFYDVEAAPDWLLACYDEIASGLSIGARREILGGVIKAASDDAIHVNGNLGAITKSFFWHSSDPQEVRVAALLKEFANKAPCIERGAREWLDTVPRGISPATVYNLMYLEQRGGRWAGAGENASSIFFESFTPFNSRELFAQISSLPVSVVSGGDLLTGFVRTLWPELLQVPYCRNYRKLGAYLPKSIRALFR
jgi:hypothetical protein